MTACRSRDTRPEKALRSAVHRLGLRYKVAVRPIPEIRRTADLVFFRQKVAVFLDGCYWHGCPTHYIPSHSNVSYWSERIDANKRRDIETNLLLIEAGWFVIRVWEHDDIRVAAAAIEAAVRQARRASFDSGSLLT